MSHGKRRYDGRMALKLRRDPDGSSPDFLSGVPRVHDRPVGRIYKKLAADGATEEWFWGLAFPYSLNEPAPFYGLERNRDAAMSKFKECWERKPGRLQ